MEVGCGVTLIIYRDCDMLEGKSHSNRFRRSGTMVIVIPHTRPPE